MSDQRDRDATGRAENQRPRDALGRPLPYGTPGEPPGTDAFAHDDAGTLAEAQRLLDTGRPFAAHEVLEARWKSSAAPQREAWQGLAQAAVALTHLRRGNVAGAQRLARRAAHHLAAGELPPGVPAAALTADLDAIAAGDDHGLRMSG